MAHITGQIRIAAPLEQVFDTVADSRNEPSFNADMTDVELLTPLPIGRGRSPLSRPPQEQPHRGKRGFTEAG